MSLKGRVAVLDIDVGAAELTAKLAGEDSPFYVGETVSFSGGFVTV